MIPVQNISYESLSFEFPYLELCLVHAGLAAGQLGYGDGHKDHQQAGGQILVLCLTLQSKKVLKKIITSVVDPNTLNLDPESRIRDFGPIWIRIQEAPEYGSNTGPDPQHC